MIASPLLRGPGLCHAFFTRAGGVSRGLYAGRNCGPGSADDPAHVAENRERARRDLAADALVTLHQVHSAAAVVVEAPWPQGAAPRADGLATRVPGLALGILSADCAPVLFADAEAGVIGAAHAGWKGALGGVLEATVAAMAGLGARPERIAAAIGPCIAQPSYEVGPEFRARFAEADGRFFGPGREDRLQFDLPGFVLSRLEGLGLAAAGWLGRDTAAEPDTFFSYRRSCLQGEADYGRLLSAIVLERA